MQTNSTESGIPTNEEIRESAEAFTSAYRRKDFVPVENVRVRHREEKVVPQSMFRTIGKFFKRILPYLGVGAAAGGIGYSIGYYNGVNREDNQMPNTYFDPYLQDNVDVII